MNSDAGKSIDLNGLDMRLSDYWKEHDLEYKEPARADRKLHTHDSRRNVLQMAAARKPVVVVENKSGPVKVRQMTDEEKEKYGMAK